MARKAKPQTIEADERRANTTPEMALEEAMPEIRELRDDLKQTGLSTPAPEFA